MNEHTLRKVCEYLNADLKLHGVHTYTLDPGKLDTALEKAARCDACGGPLPESGGELAMARYSAEVIALAYARDYLLALRSDLEDRFGRFPLSLEPWGATMQRIEDAIHAAQPCPGCRAREES